MRNVTILVKVNLPQDPDLQGLQYLFPPAYTEDIMIIILMIIYTIPVVKYMEAMIMTLMNYETCGSNVYTTSDHNDIEWFRKRETLQAKNDESFKARKNDSPSALRSKTPTKSEYSNGVPSNKLGPDLNGKAKSEAQLRGMFRSLMYLTEKYLRYLSVAKKASLVDKVVMFSAETEDIAAAGCCANIVWT
ncbi:hypothetical protein Tco_0925471 [Tanacetum coccineum]|uniref:Uncharacterized protein n=1 Tax=Tanacetum coccineum TaxID=301880 RepID=A0ABQ5D7V7_9ASTR